MIITVEELHADLDRYLELSESEEIVITRNGKIVSKLVPANGNRAGFVESITGIIPSDISVEIDRDERLSKSENCTCLNS